MRAVLRKSAVVYSVVVNVGNSKSHRHAFVDRCTVIVERIKDTHAPFYRPAVPLEESEGLHPDILTLMKQCWAEEPIERPSFDEIAKALRTINKGKSVFNTYMCLFVSLTAGYTVCRMDLNHALTS